MQTNLNLLDRIINVNLTISIVIVNELQDSENKNLLARIVIITTFCWLLVKIV